MKNYFDELIVKAWRKPLSMATIRAIDEDIYGPPLRLTDIPFGGEALDRPLTSTSLKAIDEYLFGPTIRESGVWFHRALVFRKVKKP